VLVCLFGQSCSAQLRKPNDTNALQRIAVNFWRIPALSPDMYEDIILKSYTITVCFL
jgi:hypothetical protein